MSADTANKPLMLVTGSSGLIGTLVVKEFARDFTVVGIDQKAPAENAGAGFIECDLTSDDDTARALDDVRQKYGDRVASVIHLAAYYDFSGDPSPLYRELTVEGTRRMLRGLKRFSSVEQFVFTSSLLVMEPADDDDEVITETSPLDDEPWDYPRSKIEAEKAIRDEQGEIPAVILRIAGVYNEQGNSIPIGQHIARIYERQLESYFFPGNPAHGTPYVHLDDLIECFRRVAGRRNELGRNTVLLIAEPDVMSYDELQDTIGELVHGAEWPTVRVPKVAAKAGAWVREKIGDEKTFIKPWMVDLADADYPVAIRRANEVLDWRPRHRLRDTLPKIIDRLKSNPKEFYETNSLPLPDELEANAEDEGRRGEDAATTVKPSDAATSAATSLDVAPPNLGYNPSAWRQRIPICVLAGVAFLIAAYMALYQWRLIGNVWDPVFGAQTRHVLDSETSESMRNWIGIPDAALGALAYLGDALFGLAGSTRRWQYRPWMVVLFGLDVIPLGIVSVILVVAQGAIVGAWCFLCLVTAVISLVLVWLAYDEVWATILYLWRVWKRTHAWGAMWKTFWGKRVPEADEVALQKN